MCQSNAAVTLWHAVRQNTIEEAFSIGTVDVVFRKTGQINYANMLTHGETFCPDDLKGGISPIAAVFLLPVKRKPLWPFPTEGLGMNGPFTCERLKQWA